MGTIDNCPGKIDYPSVATALHRGKPDTAVTDQLLAAGYTRANLIDILMVIGDKIISNYLHSVANFPIDFPVAEPLEEVVA